MSNVDKILIFSALYLNNEKVCCKRYTNSINNDYKKVFYHKNVFSFFIFFSLQKDIYSNSIEKYFLKHSFM